MWPSFKVRVRMQKVSETNAIIHIFVSVRRNNEFGGAVNVHWFLACVCTEYIYTAISFFATLSIIAS